VNTLRLGIPSIVYGHHVHHSDHTECVQPTCTTRLHCVDALEIIQWSVAVVVVVVVEKRLVVDKTAYLILQKVSNNGAGVVQSGVKAISVRGEDSYLVKTEQ